MSIKPKKQNVFKFINSPDWYEARVKISAMYLLLSCANELKEDVDNLSRGYEGMFVGALKHKAAMVMKSLDEYDKEFRSHLSVAAGTLCGDTIDFGDEVLEIVDKHGDALAECFMAIRGLVQRTIDECERPKNIAEKDDFELVGEEERQKAVASALKILEGRYGKEKEYPYIKEGYVEGFLTALNWLNRVYVESL